MKLIKREQVIVIDDIFTKDEIQWMEDYFTLFDGWQLIFDDPEQSLTQYSLGQVIDLPNFGEFEQFCMRVFKERSGVPVPNFHRVVYNCFRFGDSPNLHIDGDDDLVIRTELDGGVGKYGRLLGWCYIGDSELSLNEMMITEGYAWAYDGGTKQKNFEELREIRRTYGTLTDE